MADAADVASIDVLSAPEALTEQAENLRNDVVLWRLTPTTVPNETKRDSPERPSGHRRPKPRSHA